MKAKQQNLSSPVNTNTPPSYATKKHNDGNKHIRTIEMYIIYIIYIYIYIYTGGTYMVQPFISRETV